MSKQMTEYQRDLVRMWDSLRTETEYKGSHNCCPILCAQCPLNNVACSGDGITHTIFNAEKAIEVVAQWAKEHSIVTMLDKYIDVFGVEPKLNNGNYLCPRYLGFKDVTCESGACCIQCRDKFWNSEYKEPVKEEVGEHEESKM